MNGVLSIDLSSYSTAAQNNTLLANYVLASTLANYSSTTAMNSAISTAVANCIPTTHEANNVGAANVAFGAYDIGNKTVTLTNAAGVIAILSVDNAGNLNVGAAGVVTVPMLNAWQFTTMAFKDSGGSVRNLVPSLAGGLVYNSSQLVDLNILATHLVLCHLLAKR